MDQLQVLVARVRVNARIKVGHLAALTFQHLEEHALPLAEHTGDVVLPVPSMGLAQDRVGQRPGLRFNRFAYVDQTNHHGGEGYPIQASRTVARH
jgi:hypothetical protein